MSYSTGIPTPSLEWWIEDDRGERKLLHTESNVKSRLHYGPLQRHHHNNVLSCEARNNDLAPPVSKRLNVNMICKCYN